MDYDDDFISDQEDFREEMLRDQRFERDKKLMEEEELRDCAPRWEEI